MKFLEELSQFSWVKGLAQEVPVNGPWDEQIPLVPITVVYNNTLYFILASVLSTPVELLLPRSLVSSSGPNLKAIIPFICSLTFCLHLTDLIIKSLSWNLGLKDSVLEPVSLVHFLFAPIVTFLGHHFFFNAFFFFFLTLQAVSSELIFIHNPNNFHCNNNIGCYQPCFIPDGDTAALACLRAAKPRHMLISLTSHPRCFVTRKRIIVGKIFYYHPNLLFKCAACTPCELHFPCALLLCLELASSAIAAPKFWKYPLFFLVCRLQPLLRCSLWKNPGQWTRWAWSRPMWLACSPVGDVAYMQLRQNALGIVLLPSNKPPPSICRWWFAEDYNLATFCWIFMRTVNDTSLSLHWPLPHFETVPQCTLVELH